MTMSLVHEDMRTPFGSIRVVADDHVVVGLRFFPEKEKPESRLQPGHPVLEQAISELAEYFSGKRESFEVPIRPSGTDFQRAVYRALLAIPFGQTCSYSDVARHIGRPQAVRAVGAANGRNPIAIIVPCHRVIGANGALTGFGGGIPTKRWLLELEKPLLFRVS